MMERMDSKMMQVDRYFVVKDNLMNVNDELLVGDKFYWMSKDDDVDEI
jgi:hypothetical protein